MATALKADQAIYVPNGVSANVLGMSVPAGSTIYDPLQILLVLLSGTASAVVNGVPSQAGVAIQTPSGGAVSGSGVTGTAGATGTSLALSGQVSAAIVTAGTSGALVLAADNNGNGLLSTSQALFINVATLPTVDPHVQNMVWLNGTSLDISQG